MVLTKKSCYWWSKLDIEPQTDIFFFGTFGVDGLEKLHLFILFI